MTWARILVVLACVLYARHAASQCESQTHFFYSYSGVKLFPSICETETINGRAVNITVELTSNDASLVVRPSGPARRLADLNILVLIDPMASGITQQAHLAVNV